MPLNNLSFFGLTETWLSKSNDVVSSLATPPDYSFFHTPRNTRGGGVALICLNSLNPSILKTTQFPSFEALLVKITTPKSCLISVVYRPPSSSFMPFLTHFVEYLSLLASFDCPILILGDFNIHVNIPSNQSSSFLETLDLFNLSQFVHSPTHAMGNTLDLVISDLPIQSLSISNITYPDSFDHYLLKFYCPISSSRPQPSKTTVSFRQLSEINFPNLNLTLSQSLIPLTSTFSSPNDLCDSIFSSLQSSLDYHAPLISRRVTRRPNTEWFTHELRRLKRIRRAYARKVQSARRRNLDVSLPLSQLKAATKSYFSLMTLTRYNYTQNIISSSDDRQKSLFRVVNKILKPCKHSLPSISSETFANFFVDKVLSIQSTISPTNSPEISPPITPPQLSSFTCVSSDEVLKLIHSSKKTSSPSDPFPSKLIPLISSTILPYLVSLFDLSLSSGSVPDKLKHSVITPLLKKPDLDSETPSNYRPISLLPFFSKILERLVTSRLVKHMSSFLHYEIFQSGFKANHSTESALLHITNELRLSADSGKVSILVLLDLSAAFDTLNHSILINRLKTFIGLSGSALDWFISYLSHRSFQVKQNSDTSTHHSFEYGVPQGSVLGPILFRIYILPLLVLLSSLGLSFHCYADDTQLYIPCSSSNFSTTIEFLQGAQRTISDWLADNFLKLNHSKTEVILIGTPHSVAQCKSLSNSISFNNSPITFSSTVKNLGVIFDESLSFLPHIKNLRKNAFFLLRNLSHIRSYFNQSSFESIINALITSKLDYCNSLLTALPANSISLLQSIQNYAARLILRRRLRSHITPLLYELHWLPVCDRIDFKTLLITYKIINHSAPSYLLPQLQLKSNPLSLRHHDRLLFKIPRSHSVRMGDRAFSTHAPKLWNSLPFHIRNASSVDSFKKSLKTYFFSSRYRALI